MKKFLSVFIVVLLVVGAVVATCFFFFTNLKEKNKMSDSIVAMLESEENKQFAKNLNEVSQVLKGVEDLRLELIVETNEKLENIIYSLSSYYVENNTQIKDGAIANKLNSVNSSRILLNNMLKEYKIKKESTYFDKSKGANDIYAQSCVYLINYAQLASLINNSLNVDRIIDIKYNLFEVYSNIVVNSFSTLKENSTIKVIDNADNIVLINEYLNVSKLFVFDDDLKVGSNNILFNQTYATCDKQEFAKNLAKNVEATSLDESNKEQLTTKYFKIIYGIGV